MDPFTLTYELVRTRRKYPKCIKTRIYDFLISHMAKLMSFSLSLCPASLTYVLLKWPIILIRYLIRGYPLGYYSHYLPYFIKHLLLCIN